jgi:hypothetical protein
MALAFEQCEVESAPRKKERIAEMLAEKPDVAALVGRLPDSDDPGKTSTFTGPKPEAAGEIFSRILAGGKESLLELIGIVKDVGDPEFKDFRPEYALHALAVHVGRPGMEKERQTYCDAVTSALQEGKLPKAVLGILIRKLQVAGGKDAVKVIGKYLADEDLCEYAAQALLAIKEGAAEEFREALGPSKGRCRVTILQALGVVRDSGSVDALKGALGEGERAVRVAAAWALGNIGDAAAADAVMKAAMAEDGWERIQATKACLVLAERLLASGRKGDAVKIYTHLRDTRKDSPDRYVSEVADKALEAL